MSDEKSAAEPSGASGGSLANEHSARQDAEAKIIADGIAEIMRIASEPEWIPVTERLPERGMPVIGWFPGATHSFECSLNEHDGVWCDWSTGIHLYDDERPTHWMPFPDGPTDAK